MSEPSDASRPVRDLVVIGASAGGVQALVQLVRALPDRLRSTLLIVLHSSPEYTSHLADILQRETTLQVSPAVHGEPIEKGRIYVAPTDNHLTISGEWLRVVRGPRENGHRPAVDPLFRTAARAYGQRVIGVVLSGTLSCGTNGLAAIAAFGGMTVVQDPLEAEFDGMPRSALAHVAVDHVLPLSEIAQLIADHAGEAPSPPATAPDPGMMGARNFVCPACHGAITEARVGTLTEYICHVGHRYSEDAFALELDSDVEAALWAAVRALEDSAELSNRLATRSEPGLAKRHKERGVASKLHSEAIRRILLTAPRVATG